MADLNSQKEGGEDGTAEVEITAAARKRVGKPTAKAKAKGKGEMEDFGGLPQLAKKSGEGS